MPPDAVQKYHRLRFLVLCGFVSLWLCMLGCLLQEQIRLRDYELMLRNQCDLGIYLNMALVKVEQGHFETAILILHNFFVFITATGVWQNYIKYLHDSNTVYCEAAV